jgi:glycosyltransferase involved in cell wall biosynthesis
MPEKVQDSQRGKAIDAALKQIERSFGKGSIMRLGDHDAAVEIPAISTQCAGNQEIIHHGETGLLIPVDDPPALKQAILWSLDNPREMKTMAKKGRAWVISHCSVKAQVDQLNKIYSAIQGG